MGDRHTKLVDLLAGAAHALNLRPSTEHRLGRNAADLVIFSGFSMDPRALLVVEAKPDIANDGEARRAAAQVRRYRDLFGGSPQAVVATFSVGRSVVAVPDVPVVHYLNVIRLMQTLLDEKAA